MSPTKARMERRVRVAGVLVLVGLVLETISLLIRHPLGILILSTAGIAIVVAGIAMFLLGLAVHEPARHE